MSKEKLDKLYDNIRTIPDFPKPGIQFKDFTPLLGNYHLLKITSELLAKPFHGKSVQKVVGLESRGFLFGVRLAQDLKAGFVPVRKPGKLPHKTISYDYELEYGTDKIEIHADAIQSGDNVIIHDDLVATGGSAMAGAKLIEKLGGNIIGFSFIMQIDSLSGFKTIKKSYSSYSLLSV